METIHQHNCDAQMTPLLSETRNGVHFLVLQYALHQTGVTTMNAAGELTTIRTRNFHEGRFDDQCQDIVLDEDVFHQ